MRYTKKEEKAQEPMGRATFNKNSAARYYSPAGFFFFFGADSTEDKSSS